MAETIKKAVCSDFDIASYIDGELSPALELEFELHIAGCSACRSELNEQKQFLCALEAGLDSEPAFELPENFAKVVVANAESSVSGIRRRTELLNSVAVIAALLIFVVFAFGEDSSGASAGFIGIFHQAAAIGGFLAHLGYDITIGAVVILRSLGSAMTSETAAELLIPAAITATIVAASGWLIKLLRA